MKKLALAVAFILVVGVLASDVSAVTYYFIDDGGTGAQYYFKLDKDYINTYGNIMMFTTRIVHSDGSLSYGMLCYDVVYNLLTITNFHDQKWLGYTVYAFWNSGTVDGYWMNEQGKTDRPQFRFLMSKDMNCFGMGCV